MATLHFKEEVTDSRRLRGRLEVQGPGTSLGGAGLKPRPADLVPGAFAPNCTTNRYVSLLSPANTDRASMETRSKGSNPALPPCRGTLY